MGKYNDNIIYQLYLMLYLSIINLFITSNILKSLVHKYPSFILLCQFSIRPKSEYFCLYMNEQGSQQTFSPIYLWFVLIAKLSLSISSIFLYYAANTDYCLQKKLGSYPENILIIIEADCGESMLLFFPICEQCSTILLKNLNCISCLFLGSFFCGQDERCAEFYNIYLKIIIISLLADLAVIMRRFW